MISKNLERKLRPCILVVLIACNVVSGISFDDNDFEDIEETVDVKDFLRNIGKRQTAQCPISGTCGSSLNTPLACFVKPTSGITSGPSRCTMVVRVTNRNVCQLSLKFDRFKLAQPTSQIPFASQCITDSFTVSPSPTGTPTLCGDNTFQHMFIPVDASSGSASVTLNINTANLATADWKIRVAQIDCSTTTDEVAPAGCLQYFRNATGTIRSFNYNGGNGPYPPNSNYAICVKRSSSSTCSVAIQAPTFHLGSVTGATNYGTSDCDSSDSPPGSHDYLLVPAAVSSTGIPAGRESLYCGNFLESTTVTGSARGPIVLTFNSDNVDGVYGEAFQINYSQSNTCQ